MKYQNTKIYLLLSIFAILIVGCGGGSTGNSSFNEQGNWSFHTGPQTKRIVASTVSIGNKIYVTGGVDKESDIINSVEMLDTDSHNWTNVKGMSQERVYHSSTVYRGKIYVIGGLVYKNDNTDDEELSNTMEIYSPDTNTWSTGASMRKGRAAHVAASINGRIFIAGGFAPDPDDSYNEEATNTVLEYDPVADTYTSRSNMPEAIAGAAGCALNDKLYVIGGANEDDERVNTVYEYDPDNDTWKNLTALNIEVVGASCVSANNRLYITGGEIAGADHSDNFIEYDTDSETFTFHDNIPEDIAWHNSVVANNSLYLIGGDDSDDHHEQMFVLK